MTHQSKYIKRSSQKNWTDHEYQFQDCRYVSHTSMKILFATTQFPILPFCGAHENPHVVLGIIKHYYLILYHKSGHGKYAILNILYTCIACNNMLNTLVS